LLARLQNGRRPVDVLVELQLLVLAEHHVQVSRFVFFCDLFVFLYCNRFLRFMCFVMFLALPFLCVVLLDLWCVFALCDFRNHFVFFDLVGLLGFVVLVPLCLSKIFTVPLDLIVLCFLLIYLFALALLVFAGHDVLPWFVSAFAYIYVSQVSYINKVK